MMEVICLAIACPVFAQESDLESASQFTNYLSELESKQLPDLSIASVLSRFGQGVPLGLISDMKRSAYKIGDHWQVRVSHISHAMVYRSVDQGDESHFLAPLLFDFRVVKVEGSTTQIEVSEARDPKLKELNGRVQKVLLTMDHDFKITDKAYFYRDLPDPVRVKFDGSQNVPMGFDSYPIDLPSVQRTKLSIAADHTVHFDSYDLFFRKVHVEWNPNQLWPKLVETTSSRSVLQ